MHSLIVQISDKPIEKCDYIEASTFYEDNLNFADYVDDDVNPEDCLSRMHRLLDGIFECNGRELTFKGCDDFVKEWITHLKDEASKIDMEAAKDWMCFWNIKRICEKTHIGCDVRVTNGGEYPDTFGNFIHDRFVWSKPGDKFYIGGFVDYHF